MRCYSGSLGTEKQSETRAPLHMACTPDVRVSLSNGAQDNRRIITCMFDHDFSERLSITGNLANTRLDACSHMTIDRSCTDIVQKHCKR